MVTPRVVERGGQIPEILSGNANLAEAARTHETDGALDAVPSYQRAAASYEQALKHREDSTTHLLGAISLEALVEAGVAEDLTAVREHIARARELAGSLAPDEMTVKIDLVEAKLAEEEHDPEKAKDILDHINGHTPPEIAKELSGEGVLAVTSVARYLLDKKAA
jgi:hypothetical protein